MPSIEFITDQWPVCFVKIDGDQTLADFEGYISTFNRFYEHGERFAVVTYLKHYTVKGEIIKRVGTWFKETEPLIHKYWSSNAVISPSPGFRFVLSGVYLVKPLPIPNMVCSTSDEAIEFTRRSWTGPTRLGPLRWPF